MSGHMMRTRMSTGIRIGNGNRAGVNGNGILKANGNGNPDGLW